MGVTNSAVGLPRAGIAINTASVLVDISPLCVVRSLQYAVTLICLAHDAGPQPCLLCYLSWPVKALWLNTVLTTQMLAEEDGSDWAWEVDMNAVSIDCWNWIGWILGEWSWWWVGRRRGDRRELWDEDGQICRKQSAACPLFLFFVQTARYRVDLL